MPKVKTNRVQNPEGWELIEPTLRELQKEISMELYEFCLDQGYAVRNLIAKGKQPGYERLCCLRCMQPHDHNFQMHECAECLRT
ncbi:G10 family protein [Citrus sinensis]|uniref:Uncharacterized protein n=1 Tax=Citrus sinensis TaxID=2711 RepID=A0A067FCY7_CITSI|nr:G10 family protein [Citrus sinensis]KDO61076.1 hypothetical protein CISIN_1g040196mg [Citrus sinensis]